MNNQKRQRWCEERVHTPNNESINFALDLPAWELMLFWFINLHFHNSVGLFFTAELAAKGWVCKNEETWAHPGDLFLFFLTVLEMHNNLLLLLLPFGIPKNIFFTIYLHTWGKERKTHIEALPMTHQNNVVHVTNVLIMTKTRAVMTQNKHLLLFHLTASVNKID